MVDKDVKLFENKRVRTAWDEEKEDWLFSIIDVVEILTGTDNPRRYWSDLKRKLNAEGSQLYEKIVQLKMLAEDGKLRLTDVADTEQLLRLIQSIPSPKAEPFKVWLASVGKDRINETFDPELAIDRALVTYLRKGYSKDWIGQRLQAIQVRKELTDEWGERGVAGNEYAVLTDEITKAWANLTTRQYKNLKGLTKENLRDNMSMLELTLNQLAEVTTTEISKEQKPQTFEENKQVAKSGGEVAGNARRDIEKRTGKPVITSKNAIDFSRLLTDITNTENKPNTKKEK
ncbi:MAG: Bro-N domain-containing protein [Candidatus Bathyarchaeota archaeon]|nr:Bro-N domain-containing protein [Candidatus Termiticorpusculum sp.]